MNIIDYLTIIGISNLITEQSITRGIILKLFKSENYLKFSGIKKFFFDLLSCWSCTTVWIAVIYILVKQPDSILQYIYIPLICMLITDVIEKLKR